MLQFYTKILSFLAPRQKGKLCLDVNLKIKRPFKVRGNKHFFDIKRKAIPEALIQAETQIVFQLGAKDKGYL